MKNWFVFVAIVVLIIGFLLEARRQPIERPWGKQLSTYSQDDPYSVPFENSTEYYESGSGRNIIIVGGAGRNIADFNNVVKSLNVVGFKTVTTEIGADYPMSRAPSNIKYGTIEESSIQLMYVFDRLSSEQKSSNFCLIGQGYGTEVIRDTLPRLMEKGDSRLPSAVVLISPNGAIQSESAIGFRSNHPRTRARYSRPDQETFARMKKGNKEDYFYDINNMPDNWKTGFMRHQRGWTLDALLTSKRLSWPDKIDAPILVIRGQHDPFFSTQEVLSSLENQNINNVQVEILGNASRALQYEEPEKLYKILTEFLSAYCLG